MLNTIRNTGADTPWVALVHDWHRLSRDPEARGLFTRQITRLGASVETCDGEQRRPDGSWIQIARPTSVPTTT